MNTTNADNLTAALKCVLILLYQELHVSLSYPSYLIIVIEQEIIAAQVTVGVCGKVACFARERGERKKRKENNFSSSSLGTQINEDGSLVKMFKYRCESILQQESGFTPWCS